MELRQLRYVIAIAEHGSLSQAAARLFIAQSALSHQLAQLESELGAPLFERLPRGVTLTEAGHTFIGHAQSILRQVDAARISVRNSTDLPSGNVVFGIPHSVSQALALPLLKAVRAALPGVSLELTEELTGNLVPQLRDGRIDLAVLFEDEHSAPFHRHYLLDEALSLISPSPTVDAPDTPISLADALRLPLILPARPHGVRPLIESAAQAAGLAAPNVIADISSISILRTSLLAGMGCTLLPPMPLQAELQAGHLHARPLGEPGLQRRILLCHPRSIPLSTAARAVLGLTQTLCRDLAERGEWQAARWQESTPER